MQSAVSFISDLREKKKPDFSMPKGKKLCIAEKNHAIRSCAASHAHSKYNSAYVTPELKCKRSTIQ